VIAVLGGARGGELVPVLGETGRLQLAFGVLLALGLWLTA
jgi:1,4-dihydroxy-2-naphthoate octaprenyltransferase